MRRAGRVLLHAALLGLLVAGTVYGIVMLAGYVVMALGAVSGRMPMTDLTSTEWAFGVLMVVLWGGVIVAGLAALWGQGRRSVALARWVDATGGAASPKLVTAAAHTQFSGHLREVPDRTAYAFTYGIWRPRVVVSSGLVQSVSDAELVAVLRHERYHVHNRDPLKVLALRTWAAAFFFIPLVGTVLHRLLDRQELKADRAAVGESGIAPVAGALLKAVGQPAAAPGTAMAAMGGPGLLDARVSQLETGDRPRFLAGIPAAALLASVPGIGLLAVYGALLYWVCLAVELCCMH